MGGGLAPSLLGRTWRPHHDGQVCPL